MALDQWADIAKRNSKKLREVAVKASINVGSQVVKLSPVDTGFFRSEWATALNHLPPPSGNEYTPFFYGLREMNPLYQGDNPLVPVANKLKLGDTLFFNNPTEYGMALEYGYSGQAPNGMVRVSIANWQGHVDKAARAVK